MLSSMILCAGRGSRLRPLSAWCPKPLVPIGDRPALALVLDRLDAAGLHRHVVNAYYRAPDLVAFAAGRTDLRISDEPELLGTAGGVEHAAALLGEGDVLVHNGDILVDLDFRALAAAHAARAPSGTLAVRVVGGAGAGNVGLDAKGEIVRLRRETVREGEVAGAEFSGVHVVAADLRKTLPKTGCLVGDVYLPALRRGARLVGFCFEGPFTDIGSVAAYHGANLAWLERQGIASWRDPSSTIADGVLLAASIVGRDAVIDGKGAVVRTVIWPGARATAPLEDVIVTPHGTVGLEAPEDPRLTA
jgi:mannose-1-phosphate guanylyltransferase